MIISLMIAISLNTLVIVDFSKRSEVSDWLVVDDVVMGGRSNGEFSLNDEGYGLFEGSVSLDNNGGFSSIRHRFESLEVKEYDKFVIRLRGDGKSYQFRVKSASGDYYSYVTDFETSAEWQTIEIPFSELSPSFRGMELDIPNYPGEIMEEIGILIGNKKAESFRLEIASIHIEN